MVSGWLSLVDPPVAIVSDASGMVRAPVLKGTHSCELVGDDAFNAPGAHRLVDATVELVATMCVNVRAPAAMGAHTDGMVSLKSATAGDDVHGANG
jgi:hypothetical protein